MNHRPEGPQPEAASSVGNNQNATAVTSAVAHAAPAQQTLGTTNQARPQRLGSKTWMTAAVGLLAVLALSAFAVHYARGQIAQQTAQMRAQVHNLAAQLQSTTQQNEQIKARAALLEERLNQFDAQRLQLDATLQSLNNAQQETLLIDLRMHLQAAQQQAQLTGNGHILLQALVDSEKRLAAQRQPRFVAAQRAMAQDLANTQSIKLMNVAQMVAGLDTVLQRIDVLPLLSTTAPALHQPKTPPAIVVAAPQSRWLRLWQQIKDSSLQLVRVRTIASTDAALIAPEQALYVREHLRLRLLNARLALLARQPEIAQRDMDVASALLGTYFNTESAQVKTAQATLAQIDQQALEGQLPSIHQSLQALTAASFNALLPQAASQAVAQAAPSAMPASH